MSSHAAIVSRRVETRRAERSRDEPEPISSLTRRYQWRAVRVAWPRALGHRQLDRALHFEGAVFFRPPSLLDPLERSVPPCIARHLANTRNPSPVTFPTGKRFAA